MVRGLRRRHHSHCLVGIHGEQRWACELVLVETNMHDDAEGISGAGPSIASPTQIIEEYSVG
jgi:hypothetical protein